ncbi:hypothetical protein HK096_007767, partial [Nowakowskiella sp. JEL0078]
MSTTKIGTDFEYLTKKTLERYGFSLRRVGGAHDKGIDLTGVWKIPTNVPSSKTQSPTLETIRTIPVIVQCKNHSLTPGPSALREIQGALSEAHTVTSVYHQNSLAFLVSATGFTLATFNDFRPAITPMGLISLEDDGKCALFMLNFAASKLVPELNILDRLGDDISDIKYHSSSYQLISKVARKTGAIVAKEAAKRGE